MSVDLNTVTIVHNLSVKLDISRFRTDEAALTDLSETDKQTYRIASDAERDGDLMDRLILNVVHPPALVLFMLLKADREKTQATLPEAQSVYEALAEPLVQAGPTIIKNTASANMPEAALPQAASGDPSL
ncbi:hypothetical protein NAC44_04130 [Allorhizobium sp. BGMRC 0089]|uniref:hypothetical protein n=1 Tax=Allorhizobium sonneratiae TaxID=2934936 RepID=UPI002034280F|nr:hypothetical protein [Allorhizobium sonneratiae]MCM2291514.1 hypothetical protein [Allorhizobium sonneratiae]